MKIGIFTSPRTRSTVFLTMLERYMELSNYREIFSYGQKTYEVDNHRLMKLINDDNYVVKITPTSFHFETFLKYETFPWNTFDKIILLNRKNLTEQVASWLVLEYAHTINRHDVNPPIVVLEALKNVSDIRIPKMLLKYILRCINEYNQIKEFIESRDIPTLSLSYEDFVNDQDKYIKQFGEFVGKPFTKEHFNISPSNYTGADYKEFIQHSCLDTLCRKVIEENNFTYLQKEIELGNIIC